MNDWHEIPPVNHWEAWTIHVQLATLPDGSRAPIGLRIEPREDHSGSVQDQRITSDALRHFPIEYASAQATYAAHDASDEWERVRLLFDALAARMDYYDEYLTARQATAEVDLGELLVPLYTTVVEMLGGNGGHPPRTADAPREAPADPDIVGPAAHDPEALNTSLITVRRLLREARKEGVLKPRTPAQQREARPPKVAAEERVKTKKAKKKGKKGKKKKKNKN